MAINLTESFVRVNLSLFSYRYWWF